MRYEGTIYRPPSEADALILQATIGCSWNACTYCDMYRAKQFRIRPIEESLADLDEAAAQSGRQVTKVFIADGDALALSREHWLQILVRCRRLFPRLRRVSCYATARNILEKDPSTLQALYEAGLSMLYIGPESGDDITMKRIAKGATFDQHAEAAVLARQAGMRLSTIFLLGAGGVERSAEHARESARLAGAMDPRFVSLLTLTVVPDTPIAELERRGKFVLPDVAGLLNELYSFIDHTRPTDAIFRTNHASNYLPLSGRLPRDRERLLAVLDGVRGGSVALRPEWLRGL